MRSARPSRPFLVVAAAALALLLSGCGGGGDEATSEARPPASESGSGDSGTEPGTGGVEDMIPDLGGQFGDMGTCIEVAAVYATSALGALGGPEAAQQLQAQIDQLGDDVPPDVRADLEVIADAFGQVAQDGFVGGSDALQSPEFLAAQEGVQQYISESCPGGLTGGGATN